MAQKNDPAQELDRRAVAAVSLAEAQALHEAADRLRRVRLPARFSGWALYRN